MKHKLNEKRYLKELETELSIDSVTGQYHELQDYLEKEIKKLGFKTTSLHKGGLLVEAGGKGNPLLVTAHGDTIGMMVRHINPDGTVNETKTVEYNYNYAINEKIIEKLAQADGVTLLYTFEYEGYVFTSAITSEDAAKIFSKDIPWYGPCYIAKHCPTVLVDVVK